MRREHNFSKATIDLLAKRAAYICSNPDCRCLTMAASGEDDGKFIFIAEAAHISAASKGGARYNDSLTSDERENIANAIFLCANCATMIDKNNGKDFPSELLFAWKNSHETWTADNLNKSIANTLSIIDGEHHAKGEGVVTGLHLTKPAIIKPGTISTAEGTGNITATKIGG
jgi:hypothetical protein